MGAIGQGVGILSAAIPFQDQAVYAGRRQAGHLKAEVKVDIGQVLQFKAQRLGIPAGELGLTV